MSASSMVAGATSGSSIAGSTVPAPMPYSFVTDDQYALAPSFLMSVSAVATPGSLA